MSQKLPESSTVSQRPSSPYFGPIDPCLQVLVTGANGFIGSHVINEILALGYRVRGTVRDLQRTAWVQSYFDGKHGAGKLSLVEVKDFAQPGCFDEAVKGVDAVAHIASDLNFNTDPNVVVPPTIKGGRHALEAASKEPKVKSFLLTSSSTAATQPKPNEKFHINKDTWNEEDIKAAWADSWDDDSRRKWAVYGASKTQGEQELWKFVKEEKPHFKVNTILPNANFGPILDPKNQQGSTAGWITGMLQGHVKSLAAGIPPQYFVYVHDTAKLHAALATDLQYDGQRVFAFAEPFNWNDLLTLAHKYVPAERIKDVPTKIDNDSRDLSTVDTASAIKILKERYNQDAFVGLEQAVRENFESSLQAPSAQA